MIDRASLRGRNALGEPMGVRAWLPQAELDEIAALCRGDALKAAWLRACSGFCDVFAAQKPASGWGWFANLELGDCKVAIAPRVRPEADLVVWEGNRNALEAQVIVASRAGQRRVDGPAVVFQGWVWRFELDDFGIPETIRQGTRTRVPWAKLRPMKELPNG